jgi:hypothetical protein
MLLWRLPFYRKHKAVGIDALKERNKGPVNFEVVQTSIGYLDMSGLDILE